MDRDLQSNVLATQLTSNYQYESEKQIFFHILFHKTVRLLGASSRRQRSVPMSKLIIIFHLDGG
jgi:hypothetical protein